MPVIDFLDMQPEPVQLKAIARLQLLESRGHELTRPHCDYLAEGIYELRFRHIKTQYRLLYFFYRQEAVVVSHGLTKEGAVPKMEIQQARQRRKLYLDNPLEHSYLEVHHYYEKHKQENQTN